MPPFLEEDSDNNHNNDNAEVSSDFNTYHAANADISTKDFLSASKENNDAKDETTNTRGNHVLLQNPDDASKYLSSYQGTLGSSPFKAVLDFDSQSLTYLEESEDESTELEAKAHETQKITAIRGSDFVYPASQYSGYSPRLPIAREKDVMKDFLDDLATRKEQFLDDKDSVSDMGEEFIEFELSDFAIYLPGNVAHHKWEMRGLQNLATRPANSWYCFDGILRSGKLRRYVQCVPFEICSIGRYGKEFDGVGDEIWLQSKFNHKTDIYYRLKKPSPQYGRYHEGFMWLANLAKHFVDYLQDLTGQQRKVSIHNFRSDFAHWLEEAHKKSSIYRKWYDEYNQKDFRRAVAANIEFLWKEYAGTNRKRSQHTLWSEIKDMDYIPAQPMKQTSTIVTPFVYECFSHMKFRDHLKKVKLSGEIESRRQSQGHLLHLTLDSGTVKDMNGAMGARECLETYDFAVSELRSATRQKMLQRHLDVRSIAIGDVLGVTKDKNSSWRDEVSNWKAADDCWWVLVQAVHENKRIQRSFDVIWLYKPSDTSCAKMKYPYHDELFLSDNCNCGMPQIAEDEVVCKASVTWHGTPGQTKSDFFVRQTYLHDNSFVTLKESHKHCAHMSNKIQTPFQEAIADFRIGDTVLILPPQLWRSIHELEPAEITKFIPYGENGVVCVKRLRRRRDVEDSTLYRPNELVYTEEIFTIKPEKVISKCLVRFYTEKEVERREIPAPYCRDGTASAFYITTRLVESAMGDHLQPIWENLPLSLKQGFDPTSVPPKERLRGLDLFCGGGNFGRGLEEGGAIRMTHAVDLDQNAIHTYHANLEDPASTKLFFGSVNDVLYQALQNNPSRSNLIPVPGMIEFMSAGSPCQGYSLLNQLRGNESGLKNQSLVASVAAYVDVFRPKYALLENVPSMAQKGKGRDEDVLSQLICCLVGMGYQVQLFLLDAWSCGSAQSRSRLFVSMAAPGLKLPQHPGLSHSHPIDTLTRGLGLGANGQSFGQRKFEPTPFEFVTASEAIDDLPDIGDARTDHCTRHPDHRIILGISHQMKTQIELIPTNPRGMNFMKTCNAGLMTEAERHVFPRFSKNGQIRQAALPGSRAFGRIHPQKLFPTISTSCTPQDARTGCSLHWDQQRVITVMEARRAQSFPDHEVLTGLPPKQWRLVGNSVARTVSLALGISIRAAWLGNSGDESTNAWKLAVHHKDTTISPSTDQDQFSLWANVAINLNDIREEIRSSSNDATLSEERYHHSLEVVGLRSSISQDELGTSGNSTPTSDQNHSRSKKRTRSQAAGPVAIMARQKKAKKMVVTTSEVSLQDDKYIKMPVLQGSVGSLTRDFDRCGPGSKSRCIERQRSMHRSCTPVEPESLIKALKAVRNAKETLAQSKKGKQINSATVSKPSVKESPPGAVSDARRNSPRYRQQGCLPVQHRDNAIGPGDKSVIVDRMSDADDQEDEIADSEDELVFIKSEKKQPYPYVPVDNSMFAAYERTHNTMRMDRNRKQKR